MDKKSESFSFLDTGEFLTLPARERATYLSLAAQELEARQRKLREQLRLLNEELPAKT